MCLLRVHRTISQLTIFTYVCIYRVRSLGKRMEIFTLCFGFILPREIIFHLVVSLTELLGSQTDQLNSLSASQLCYIRVRLMFAF